MPEHDIDDLDAAFARLEQDITGATAPRGAGAAITTARRRRRRTTIGAAAAVALVAIGSIVLTQGIGTHETSIQPIGLPSPAPYDNDALTKATKGWAGPWGNLTTQGHLNQQLLDPHCLAKLNSAIVRSAPDPTGSGGGIAVTPGAHEMARSWLVLWGGDHPDQARAAYAALVPAFAGCSQAAPAHSFAWVDAQAQSWDVTSSGPGSQHLWVAQADNAVGIVWMGGSAGPVPGDVDRRVAHALVAGLRSPASFPGHQVPAPESSSSSATTSPQMSGTVGAADFASALGGWSSGWSATGGKESADGLPCGADTGAAYGEGTSLGGNGDQELYGYDNRGDAAGALQGISKQLHHCADSAYDVSTVSLGSGNLVVTVAAATGTGNDVVWMARDGARIYAVTVPAGSSPPPRQVTQAVGGLLLDALHGTSATTEGGPAVSASPAG